jgi:hypothetical protein
MRSFEIIGEDGSKTEWIEIEISEGHFTQMTKEAYDKQQIDEP